MSNNDDILRFKKAYLDVAERLDKIEFDIKVAKITLEDITTKLVLDVREDD